MALPEVSLTRFAERLNREILAKRIPLTGSLELTLRCNLRCVHCYCNLPVGEAKAMSRELTTEEVLGIYDQIAEAGCLWLLITGGEPLVRKDFHETFANAKQRGFILTLFTNGTLITPETADFLAEWRPYSIEITLYGATRETYEKITRVPGSFEKCLRGIDLLLDRDLPLALKTMAMTVNRHEVFQIQSFARDRGLKFRFDPVLNPRLDRSREPCKYRLSPEEVLALDLEDENRVKEWREFCAAFPGPVDSNALYVCGAGISTFHIDPYGRMSPCEMTRHQSFDLRSGRFREGWDDAFPRFLSVKARDDYPCKSCDLISLCNQCPGWAWLENGDPQTPVEHLCRIAHLRARAFQGS